ncbi:MAG: transaldolase family protein [Bradymonadales bacterium]|nr:transaldolase family protein [Bradymonadales bacterium]
MTVSSGARAGGLEVEGPSPLLKMTAETPTILWNDSCSRDELRFALRHGAVGATSNPVIVATVLKQELELWRGRIRELIAESPERTEEEIVWALIEEISLAGAELLMPIFRAGDGRKGRLAIQIDPRLFRDPGRMVGHAVHLSGVAPNIIVKIPATRAGIAAMEEATYRGVSVAATVSFTVSQALQAAEAIERGLLRREREGLEVSRMGPICAVMVGRLDDWLKVVVNNCDLVLNPEALEWAGVAVMKRAYELYQRRGYRTRLCAAAYRNHFHWSEFIGGDLVLTIPHNWQKRFIASDVRVEQRIHAPVPQRHLSELRKKLTDFSRAYDENGLQLGEFDFFGATRRTLRQFHHGYETLVHLTRDFLIPDPDCGS